MTDTQARGKLRVNGVTVLHLFAILVPKIWGPML